jgi:hypothetical protein
MQIVDGGVWQQVVDSGPRGLPKGTRRNWIRSPPSHAGRTRC